MEVKEGLQGTHISSDSKDSQDQVPFISSAAGAERRQEEVTRERSRRGIGPGTQSTPSWMEENLCTTRHETRQLGVKKRLFWFHVSDTGAGSRSVLLRHCSRLCSSCSCFSIPSRAFYMSLRGGFVLLLLNAPADRAEAEETSEEASAEEASEEARAKEASEETRAEETSEEKISEEKISEETSEEARADEGSEEEASAEETSEDTGAEGTGAEETSAEGTSEEGTSEDGTNEESSEEAASAEETSEDTSVKETTEETSAKDTDEETSVKETTEETSVKKTTEETIVKNTNEETSVQNTDEETSVKETNEETSAKDTNEETSVKETNEDTSAKDTNEETSVKNTNEDTSAKDTHEETSAKDTNEETSAKDTNEETNDETSVKETNEETRVKNTNEETSVKETNEETSAKHTNEETSVKETNEETSVKDTNEETSAKHTNEETSVKETNEETRVKDTNEETSAKDTNEKTRVKDTNEETSVKVTNEDTSAKHTNEETCAKDTIEETSVKETNEETSVKDTNEETSVKETNEETSAKDTNEGTSAKHTNEETCAKDTNEETSVKHTNEEPSAKHTNEDTSAKDTNEETSAKETSVKDTKETVEETTEECNWRGLVKSLEPTLTRLYLTQYRKDDFYFRAPTRVSGSCRLDASWEQRVAARWLYDAQIQQQIQQQVSVRGGLMLYDAQIQQQIQQQVSVRRSDGCMMHRYSSRSVCEEIQQQVSVRRSDGCMMHRYSSSQCVRRREASTCLSGKKVVFVGDSRIRALFISFISIIASQKQFPIKKHADISFKDNSSTAQVAPVKPDALIVGAATWVIRDFRASAEGLHQYKVNLTAMSEALHTLALHGDVYWHVQEPVNWRALSQSRRMITDQQIDLYNEAAAEALGLGRSHIRTFSVPRLAALQTINQSTDGAMVLLNSLCNKHMRPIDGSCCQNTPPLTFLQKMALSLFVASTLLFLLFHFLRKRPHRRPLAPDVESLEEKKPATAAGPPGAEAACGALCRMGLIMVYFYLCDRADVFMKEQKYYSHSAFFIPLINVFVLGVFCSESTKESRVLNREQTDEWKGWMQLVILIYHISGASAFIPVYMHVRVLVAAYLFQTGYGHFSFFWLKGDFGLYRVCQVLFRLNFLVLVLCAVMDRPYQFYYFVPLVSFWFVLIYSALAVWPQIVQKKANNSVLWHLGILLKLLGVLLLICLFASSQGLFESTFTTWPLSQLFQLNGNIHEWWFRWKLDRFAVVQGMLFAFFYLLLQKKQVLSETKGDTLFSAKVSLPLLLLSGLSFITYSVWASSCQTKAQCNQMHPYISVVPILAFILIRNIPAVARSVYSSFFAWFGKISLELFICQYHIWLAADTKGILVLIPGNPSLNILLSSFIFVCVAHEISLITNVLAQLLIPKDTVCLLKRLGAVGSSLCCLGSGVTPPLGPELCSPVVLMMSSPELLRRQRS
ncbi:hypothetical protein WMY93_019627 [Mugilogobius chulae]|uniref:Cas1p 10 TM acyl transferase domain-containing protein n=1 Tax=Mugilogobius chulae TaxID=88201 RepID=A0AAW0NRZ2_9GOBI